MIRESGITVKRPLNPETLSLDPIGYKLKSGAGIICRLREV